MRAAARDAVSPAAREAVLGWLPDSEFAASLLDDAGTAVEAVDEAWRTVVAVALVVEGRMSLSGAPVVVACAGDPAAVAAIAPHVAPRVLVAGRAEVAGPAAVARPVAEAIATRIDGSVDTVMDQRLFVATEARPPTGVAGHGRRAVAADHPVLAAWLDDFGVEALGLEPHGVDHWVERLRDAPWEQWVWEVDGEAVSLVNDRATTPVSSRLGPVWTPPELRGRGYAGACTAFVTDLLLRRGDERVTLFTDEANPTSNALYARVGFTDVGAHGSWLVTAP